MSKLMYLHDQGDANFLPMLKKYLQGHIVWLTNEVPTTVIEV